MATVDPDFWKRKQAEARARQEQRAMTQRGMAEYREKMKAAHGHTRGRAGGAGAPLLTGTGPGQIAAAKGADAKGAQEHRHAVAAQAAKDNAKGRPAGRIGGAPRRGGGGRSPMGSASLASHGPRGGRPRASLTGWTGSDGKGRKGASLLGHGASLTGWKGRDGKGRKGASLLDKQSSLLDEQTSLADHSKGLHDFRSADRYGRGADGKPLNWEEYERLEKLKAAGRQISAKGPPTKEDEETLGRIRAELDGVTPPGAGRPKRERPEDERPADSLGGGGGFHAGHARGEQGAEDEQPGTNVRVKEGRGNLDASGRLQEQIDRTLRGGQDGGSVKMRSVSAGGEEEEESEQSGTTSVRIKEERSNLDASDRLQEQLNRVMRGKQDGGSVKMRSVSVGGEEEEESEQSGTTSVRIKEERGNLDASDRLQEQIDRTLRGGQDGGSVKMRSASVGGEEEEEDAQGDTHVRVKEEPAAMRPILSADAIQVHSLTGPAPKMPGTRLAPQRRAEDLMVSAFTAARRGRLERGFVVA